MPDVRIVELESSSNTGVSHPCVLGVDHAAQQRAAAMPKHNFHLQVANGEVLQALTVELLTVAERHQTAVLEAVIDDVLADVFEVDRAAVLDDGRIGRCAANEQRACEYDR